MNVGPTAIHRHVIQIDERPCSIMLPLSAKVILVAHQPERMDVTQIGLWAEVPISSTGHAMAPVERLFEVHGTGMSIPGRRSHVGSVIIAPYVWHVFERSS